MNEIEEKFLMLAKFMSGVHSEKKVEQVCCRQKNVK